MNKKILILTLTMLSLVILTTPLVGAIATRRNMSQVFTATVQISDPTTEPAGVFVPGNTKYVGPKDSEVPPNPANPENRKYQLNKGGMFFGIINSDQLGEGTMTSIPIIGLMDLETGQGTGVFKWIWEFDNEICKGTIEGVYSGDQMIVPPLMYIQGSALLCKGTGDLQNVKIEVASYEVTLNLMTFTTEGFTGTIQGTMWGWNP